MRPSEVLEKNREAIREATKRFNAANPRVFGSVARGEDRQDANVLIATALGVGFTVLLGTGLMVLTFLSSRSGHDEEAGRTRIEDDE